jgi:porphobilinogen synthase
MAFPATRFRRLRRTEAIRRLVRETRVAPADLVQPLFVVPGEDQRQPIELLPGVERLSIDHAVEAAREAEAAGLAGVLLFGIPSFKDEAGSEAYDDEGIVQLATRAIKLACPELPVLTDVCLCQYTSHGACGVLRGGEVDNDLTLELLARTASSHAAAGADIVAPSDMMDGRVGAIRAALDAEGHEHVAILSYSSKFASAFYGPFREAAGSAPKSGDRKGYQLDPANGDEALRESLVDVDEGADMLMVKPAGPYLDVIARLADRTLAPIAAYQVGGEYAMLRHAADAGAFAERDAVLESLVGIRRAGADVVITYYATRAAGWLA